MNLDQKRERYLNNPRFHILVDTMRQALVRGEVNMLDLVPAAELAAELYLMEDVQQTFIAHVPHNESLR